MRVTVLCGGMSSEREVSLMTSVEVQKALVPEKYDVTVVEIPCGVTADSVTANGVSTDSVTANGVSANSWISDLINSSPQLVFSALHGGLGENGAVQGLLECLGIPYTGSKIFGSALCMDKAMSKSVMRAGNIPVPEDVLIPRGEPLARYGNAVARMGFPSEGKAVVKPNSGGSSVGVSIVSGWAELERAFAEVSLSGDDILIEQFIPGREITCGLVETREGLQILPVLDITAGDGAAFYDYDAKYFSDVTQIKPSGLPPFLRGMAERLAEQAFIKLHCGGYARVDMMVRGEQVYVLEVNTLPGLTSHSLLPNAAALRGWNFSKLMDIIIENAVN